MGPDTASTRERRTARLRMRALTALDLGFFVRLQSDPRTTLHRPSGPATEAECRADLASYVRIWEEHDVGYWLVHVDDVPIGVAGLRPLELHGRRCWNLFYRFVPEVWGRGYAVEASREATAVADALEPRLPVVARTHAVNGAAIAVAERAGLVRCPDLDADGFVLLARGW